MTFDFARRQLFQIGIATAALLGSPWAIAQDSNRPVRIVVPFTAGSQTDVIARLMSRPMGEYLKQSVIVDNRPGAAATVGAQSVLSEPADGHAILFVSSAYAVLPYAGMRLPYNPEKDLSAVSIVARSPTILFASRASGFKTTADLIAAAKAKPDSLNFGSSGIGSGTHLNAEYLASVAGFKATHVPYKGGRDVVTEVIANRVEYGFLPASDLVGFGPDKLTLLGVSSKERVALMKEVPPISETGLPGFEYFLWQAMLLKTGTPPALIDRINKSIAHALADPAVKKGFADLGIDAMKTDVAAAQSFLSNEMEKTAALIKKQNLKLSQ